jgi:energy-coupling factor transport system ATP-binding protein
LSIVLNGLSFSYDRDPVLENVCLSVERGLTHLVLGPTGCGKTTLALLIVGLLRPDEGNVLVDGADPAGRAFPRHTIQLAFQFPEAQMFEVTVEKEIAYGLKNFGLPDGECRERCLWALDSVGLSGGFLTRDPRGLSFGEQRKVALASVIALKPVYLILDEPLAGLDWNGRKSLVGTIETLKDQGMTSVILTHEADLLGEAGDMILAMSDGGLSGPRPVADFLYGAPRPAGVHLPEFVKLVQLMTAGGFHIEGRPYRLRDAADAVEIALGRVF